MSRPALLTLSLLPLAAALLPTPRTPLPPRPPPPNPPTAPPDYHSLRFGGVEALFGAGSRRRLAAARVVVVGLGGVGSWAVEALARSGVGALTLVDLDDVCVSNTNRQAHALLSTVGRRKAAVLAARVAEINPECEVVAREEWLLPRSAAAVLAAEAAACADGGAFGVVDAIDGAEAKAALLHALAGPALAHAHVVTVGAAGGKADPTLVRSSDLLHASNDRLLAAVRRTLRRQYSYPSSPSPPPKGEAWGVPCVYSIEPARAPARGRSSCEAYGTACFATGAFGFAAAAALTAPIARGEPPPRRRRGVVMAAGAEVFDAHRHTPRARGGEAGCVVSTGEAEWEAALGAAGGGGGGAAAVGVHPWHAHEQREGWEARLEGALAEQPAACVGEAGIDKARLDCPWPTQLHAFDIQLRLAATHRRALILHCVRAYGTLLSLLLAAPSLPPVVVLHSFGGSPEVALSLSRLPTRVYFGFCPRAAGRKHARQVIAAAREDRILIESDAHDAAQATRDVHAACAAVAAARGWDEEHTARVTASNALQAFDPSLW